MLFQEKGLDSRTRLCSTPGLKQLKELRNQAMMGELSGAAAMFASGGDTPPAKKLKKPSRHEGKELKEHPEVLIFQSEWL